MVDVIFKRCFCCNQVKSSTHFYSRKTNKDGLYSYCKKCCAEKKRDARNKNQESAQRKKEYDRKRYERLKKEYIERAKHYHLKNKEKRIKAISEWVRKNPERRKAISQSYKHRRRSVEKVGMTGKEFLHWKKSQDKVCHWCGANCEHDCHVDHYFPLSKGGLHEAANLVISCKRCNLLKSSKDPVVFAQQIKHQGNCVSP